MIIITIESATGIIMKTGFFYYSIFITSGEVSTTTVVYVYKVS
jgi:hypothetical protein